MLSRTILVTAAGLLALGTASAHADHDRRVQYVVGGALIGATVGALAYESRRDRRHAHRRPYYPAHYYSAPPVRYVPAPRYRHVHVSYVPAPVVVVPPGHVRRLHKGPKHRRHGAVYYAYRAR